MEGSLDVKSYPLGFRFHPTNVELIMFYLKRKVLGKSLGRQMISELDVNNFAPWELPAKAYLKSKDRNWYFFCPRSKKYPTGGRVNRSTKLGYWKSTGEDKDVEYASRVVGKIKHLVFHSGKAPKGERTNWVMHEYRLEDKLLADKGVPQDSYVICKLFEKSGTGPKNGEDYGARFLEEEWDSDTDENVKERKTCSSTDAFMGAPATTATATPIPFTDAAVASTATMTSSIADYSMGAPCITATSVDVPKAPTASVESMIALPTTEEVGAPAATATPTPFIDAAVAITATMTSSIADSCMGAPCITTTSVDVPNAPTASVESTIALPTTEEEVDRLLKYFHEDDGDVSDIYIGLEELASPSVQCHDWCNLINEDNCFIEMDDLPK